MILHCLASSGTWPQDALDGGNRILIELSRRWSKKPGVKIVFHIYDKFQSFYRKHGLDQIEYSILPSLRLQHANLFFFFLFRTLCNVFWALTVKPVSSGQHYVYSSSDAWPDFWAGLILKLRFGKKIVWIAALYLFVPFVLSKNSFHRGRGIIIFLRGFFYYLMQYPVKYLIKLQADMVFVTSEPDRDFFITGKRPREKIIVIRGGVDADTPRSLGNVPAEYDAVFIGRFHAQKGAVELIDIWKKVCARKNGSRLAMIGAGPLETVIRKKIGEYNLEKNISFFGFLDGIPKLEVFKKSRMVLHPAIYDSGGMAACEAMACGLPGVSFDLPALKTYYPQGMLKTACFDFEAFAANILRLLYDETLYQKLSCEALALVRENWDWNKRAEDIWNEVFKIKSPE